MKMRIVRFAARHSPECGKKNARVGARFKFGTPVGLPVPAGNSAAAAAAAAE